MPNAIETFRSARQRINPEGLAFSGAVTLSSPIVMLPLQAGITYAVHEASKEANPTLLKFFTIGILAVANAASIAAETKALAKENYSASPVASTLNILTGKPLLSSLGGHLFNYAGLSALSPIEAAIVGDKKVLLEGAIASSLTLPIWFTSLNTLVLTGKTRPFIETVARMRRVVEKKFKKTNV